MQFVALKDVMCLQVFEARSSHTFIITLHAMACLKQKQGDEEEENVGTYKENFMWLFHFGVMDTHVYNHK